MWSETHTEADDEAQYSIPLLSELSLSNTVSFLEAFDGDCVRSTVHNWVHKADLLPESGRCPNHVAVDETVLQLDNQQCWLDAAVDPKMNDLHNTKFELTKANVIADQFFAEFREEHEVDDAAFLVDGAVPLQRACQKHGLNFRHERHGTRNSVEHVICEVKHRTIGFQTVSATLTEKLLTRGSDPSHGIGLSTYYHW